MVTVKQRETHAHTGDWVEVHGPFGKPPRRGQVTEILGTSVHERYRVRWDEKHESILYPAGGFSIVHDAGEPGGERDAGQPARAASHPPRRAAKPAQRVASHSG